MFSVDSIIREDILVSQPEKGFRFSSDAVYLAWFASACRAGRIVDIGSGSGVIATLLACVAGIKNIDAVEMQDVMYGCLCETVKLCGIDEKVRTFHADIRDFRPEGVYDAAVCNPPYRKPGSGREPHDKTELNARFAATMKISDVFEFCRKYLKNAGSLYLSYDADMLSDLFESAAEQGFEAKRLMPVMADIHVKPKIVLAEFRKNSGREMSFEPPLFLKVKGEPTDMAVKILKGEWN